MANVKKLATYGNLLIRQLESNTIEVVDQTTGALLPNAKEAMRQLSGEIGFRYDSEWNTRTFGSKLIDFISERNPTPVSASATSVTPQTTDADQDSDLTDIVTYAPDPSDKIRVHGKAQNRTSLGIMHAYLTIYPDATLADFQKAFPDSLNPDSGVKVNFVDAKEYARQNSNWKGYFTADEELLNLKNGQKVAVVSMWTRPSFERLVARAKEFGIVIASYSAVEKGFGKRGGFELEYLNGWTPPVAAPAPLPVPEKKSSKLPIFIILALLVAAGAFLAMKSCNKEAPAVEPPVAVAVDTTHAEEVVETIEDMERDFNATRFAKNDTSLTPEAQMVLDELATYMAEHEGLRLRVVGHSSKEGDAAHNQQLSEHRAAAVVSYLVSKGINAQRIESEGKGSSEPLDENDLEINRRTEFIILK